MKLEKLKNIEINKNEMISIKGGTSTTLMIEVGRVSGGKNELSRAQAENEYFDCDGSGTLSDGDSFQGTVEIKP